MPADLDNAQVRREPIGKVELSEDMVAAKFGSLRGCYPLLELEVLHGGQSSGSSGRVATWIVPDAVNSSSEWNARIRPRRSIHAAHIMNSQGGGSDSGGCCVAPIFLRCCRRRRCCLVFFLVLLLRLPLEHDSDEQAALRAWEQIDAALQHFLRRIDCGATAASVRVQARRVVERHVV